mmetsp:Transcript_14370/g.44912  ORF Transcript_14370/g.44912 Transcript_14370/m.44912 type:complete len:228 (-) Transcript_14370:264-947(-)
MPPSPACSCVRPAPLPALTRARQRPAPPLPLRSAWGQRAAPALGAVSPSGSSRHPSYAAASAAVRSPPRPPAHETAWRPLEEARLPALPPRLTSWPRNAARPRAAPRAAVRHLSPLAALLAPCPRAAAVAGWAPCPSATARRRRCRASGTQRARCATSACAWCRSCHTGGPLAPVRPSATLKTRWRAAGARSQTPPPRRAHDARALRFLPWLACCAACAWARPPPRL